MNSINLVTYITICLYSKFYMNQYDVFQIVYHVATQFTHIYQNLQINKNDKKICDYCCKVYSENGFILFYFFKIYFPYNLCFCIVISLMMIFRFNLVDHWFIYKLHILLLKSYLLFLSLTLRVTLIFHSSFLISMDGKLL